MKIYAVCHGDEYSDAYIAAVFTTRELAEQHIGAGLRREWDRLLKRGGQIIPRAGYKDGKGGIVPQREPTPADFDEWCRLQGGGYIEEYEVLDDALPA